MLRARIVEPVPLMRLRLGDAEVDQQIDVELWCGERQTANLTLSSEGKVMWEKQGAKENSRRD